MYIIYIYIYIERERYRERNVYIVYNVICKYKYKERPHVYKNEG